MSTTLFDPTSQDAAQQQQITTTKHASWGARIFLIIMSLLFLIPIYWMIITAFKTPADLAQASPSWLPRSWAWSNFKDAFDAFPFGRFFVNSVIITALVVIGTIVSNLVVAYGFSCIEWPGRDKLFYVVIATMFLPSAITLIPVFDLWGWLHAVNSWVPLILPSFFASAFFVFLLRQFMLQIPKDLLDAARIEGASESRVLWRIVAPMSRPALAVVAIFSALGAWNDFMGPLIYLQDQHLQTLAIGLQYLRQTQPDKITTNLLMAASVMVIVPVIILFFLFQRYFIRGITLGSIK
ncbi:MAG TPA: carbohydrate ABC transporter permease [Mycobacteriales bacterium]|nr:carbohydrate ABC transporter permease [Mycobacteriales bacterium]